MDWIILTLSNAFIQQSCVVGDVYIMLIILRNMFDYRYSDSVILLVLLTLTIIVLHFKNYIQFSTKFFL